MMGNSIQEMLRKINSYLRDSLSFIDILALGLTFIVLGGGFLWITHEDYKNRPGVLYQESDDYLPEISSEINVNRVSPSGIIASRTGKTYFYSWCKGVEKIKEVNKITFSSEEEARASGRVLSKTCAGN
jgi:hypothetical protein